VKKKKIQRPQTAKGRRPPSTLKGRHEKKIVNNYQVLRKIADGLRAAGCKIVVTIGSWDMLHIGHLRYLLATKNYGDYLIVGVDSDHAIKKYKGPHRPVVPEDERLEMLSYQEPVDFVTLVDDVDTRGRWLYGLIRAIRPDVFVAVEDSYPPAQRRAIRRYCRKLVVLPRQAERTSSTNIFKGLIRSLPGLMEAVDRR